MTNQIIQGDARKSGLEPRSVAAAVFSPPYNIDADYGDDVNDALPWPEYQEMVLDVAEEMFRVLDDRGRIWVNVQPTVPFKVGKSDKRINLSQMWASSLDFAGFHYRDTVTWIQDSFDGACAWGSWRQPSAPNQRGSHEVILCYYKGEWKRPRPESILKGWKDDADETGEWANDLCRNVWRINPVRSKNHPSQFPVELPARCIRLSTWPGETVLDPFVGAGNTLRAAEALGRNAIGIDLSTKAIEACASLDAGI
jgi:site-specific DNA-methyltransferase (adenine-specific)